MFSLDENMTLKPQLCDDGHEMTYTETSPYKGWSISCDRCKKDILRGTGFFHCFVDSTDYC